jgi:5'-nucleotidase
VRVLVTNDDGIDAEGIAVLTRVVADAGYDVVVVAPERNMSGMSAALGPVELGAGRDVERVDVAATQVAGCPGWAVAAPPSLGVFAAAQGGFGPPPELVVSGINAGLNTGRSVLHSGTVGAALTAATFGIPAMAVSLATGSRWRWDTAGAVAREALRWLVAHPSNGSVLNVNVPARDRSDVHGLCWAPLDLYGAVQTVGEDPGKGLTFELRSADRPAVPGSDLALVEAGYATASIVHALSTADPAALRPIESPGPVVVAPRQER